MQFISTRGAVGVALALVMTVPAWAGGFQLQSQGAKAAGRGNAFAASADDASAVFYNPAGVKQLDGFSFYLGAGFYTPSITFEGPSGSADMQDVNYYPAQFYFTAELTDNYALAFGAWVPYELRTHWWESDPVSTSALKTNWTSRNYSANVIVRASPAWTVAVGIDFLRFEVNDFSRKYDFTTLTSANPSLLFPTTDPLFAEQNEVFSGDKAGAVFALHYRGEESGYRFGLTLRTKKVVPMEGYFNWTEVSEATFTRVGNDPSDRRWIDQPTPTNPQGDGIRNPGEPWWITQGDWRALFQGGTADCPAEPEFCPMGHAFTGSRDQMSIVIPATLQVGFGRDGQGSWDWEVDLLYTQWSDWDQLGSFVWDPNGVFNQQNVLIPTTESTSSEESWSDTITISAGFDYHVNDSNAIRAGLIIDPSPVDSDFAKPYNPDSDKYGLTFGYGFRTGSGLFGFDLYAQYFLHSDLKVPGGSPDPLVFEGTYETDSIAAGASFQFHF